MTIRAARVPESGVREGYNGTGSTSDAANFHPVVSPHAHDYSQWIGNYLFYQPVDASSHARGRHTGRSERSTTHA